jgi:hypothetical protein
LQTQHLFVLSDLDPSRGFAGLLPA